MPNHIIWSSKEIHKNKIEFCPQKHLKLSTQRFQEIPSAVKTVAKKIDDGIMEMCEPPTTYSVVISSKKQTKMLGLYLKK